MKRIKPTRIRNFLNDNVGQVYTLDNFTHFGEPLGLKNIGQLEKGEKLKDFIKTYLEACAMSFE